MLFINSKDEVPGNMPGYFIWDASSTRNIQDHGKDYSEASFTIEQISAWNALAESDSVCLKSYEINIRQYHGQRKIIDYMKCIFISACRTREHI